MSSIPDSPTSRGQQGFPELISRLTDLCESAPFLYSPPPPPPPRKKQQQQQQQQKRRSLRRFSWRRYGKTDLTYNYFKREELKAGFMC